MAKTKSVKIVLDSFGSFMGMVKKAVILIRLVEKTIERANEILRRRYLKSYVRGCLKFHGLKKLRKLQ